MGVQDIIAESKKKKELEVAKRKEQELNELRERLTEIEEQIRQENLESNIMPTEVDETLQNRAIKDCKDKEEEQKRLIREREIKKKKLEDEEKELEANFSEKVQGSVDESRKIFGYLKRYILIGLVTGFPGIALTYLFDKWQDNKMIDELYQAHINTLIYPDNIELQKMYQQKRNEFCKVYDIDKIEKTIKQSELITKMKSDKSELIKLNEEIKTTKEMYKRTIDLEIDKVAEITRIEEEEAMENQEEMDQEFELELKRT